MKQEIEKKTFELPSFTAKRLKLAAALLNQYEREIVEKAINEHLDRLGIPRSFDLPLTNKE